MVTLFSVFCGFDYSSNDSDFELSALSLEVSTLVPNFPPKKLLRLPSGGLPDSFFSSSPSPLDMEATAAAAAALVLTCPPPNRPPILLLLARGEGGLLSVESWWIFEEAGMKTAGSTEVEADRFRADPSPLDMITPPLRAPLDGVCNLVRQVLRESIHAFFCCLCVCLVLRELKKRKKVKEKKKGMRIQRYTRNITWS
jgi:hypothetical protein